MFEKRIREINARRAEIRALLEKEGEVDLEALTRELDALDAEEATLNQRRETAERLNRGGIPATPGAIPNPITRGGIGGDNGHNPEQEETLYRSAWLKRLQRKNLTDAETRSISSATDSGGPAIPEQTQNEIIRKLKKIAPLLEEITLLQVAGNVRFAVENTVNAATAPHTENALVDASADSLISVSLGGYEIVKLIRISDTVATMSINAFEDWLTDNLSESVAVVIENWIINGSGVGQPKGVAKAQTWVDTTNAVKWAAASPTYAEICETVSYLPAGYDRNAKWLMNKKTFWNKIQAIRDDGKAPIVKDDGRGGYIVLGYPVLISDYVVDNVLYLGDMKKIVANLAKGINVAASAASGFAYNSIDYRGTAIFDCSVAIGEAFVKSAATL